MVGSQTTSLTPDPSFAHNLGCGCPNGSCKAILDIYTSRSFQRYKEHLKARCFALCCWALKLRGTPSSHFWECESHPHTLPKVGLWHTSYCFVVGGGAGGDLSDLCIPWWKNIYGCKRLTSKNLSVSHLFFYKVESFNIVGHQVVFIIVNFWPKNCI